MIINNITWQDILSILSKYQNLFGLLFIGIVIFFSFRKKGVEKKPEVTLPQDTSSSSENSGKIPDNSSLDLNWNARHIASFTMWALVVIVVLCVFLFPKVLGWIILGILLLSLFLGATKFYSHFFNKKETASTTSSSVTSSTKTTKIQLPKWLKWLLFILLIIALLWWNPGYWGMIEKAKSGVRLWFIEKVVFDKVMKKVKKDTDLIYKIPQNRRVETISTKGEFEVYAAGAKNTYYYRVKDNKTIAQSTNDFPYETTIILHTITDVEDLIVQNVAIH